ncbi:MAG: TetR/AcrR family transcriptional regulator [Maricaulaceae bacterium]|jgi:AcrR family transcriptional regulator
MKDSDDFPDGADDNRAETPAERRRRKIRATIVEVAENVFSQEGEDGLSMRRLADEIDYSPAAIYKYFKSKDELLNEIREQFYLRLAERLDASVDENRFDKESFCAFARAYIQTGVESPNHYHMAFLNYRETEPRIGAAQQLVSERYNAFVAGMISAGKFRPAEAKLAATSIWASLHGVTKFLAWVSRASIDPADHPLAGYSSDELIDFHVEAIHRSFAA